MVDVSVFYFPNYHVDKRNEALHGKGWTEWDLVKAAVPRFEGHKQPKVPLLGYTDEADPVVMAEKMKLAADSGITNFIFDWYYYNDGPFLERALEEGFLKAENPRNLKFSVMWANHDWVDIHPAKRGVDHVLRPVQMSEIITEETFVKATDRMIDRYFCHPNYYKIDGECFLSIYNITGLINSFKTVGRTRKILDGFRERAAKKGIKLHLNAVICGVEILPGENVVTDINRLTANLSIDSITSYVWAHHIEWSDFPTQDYVPYARESEMLWKKFEQTYSVPYYPNVSVGWDSSPRTTVSDKFEHVGYPFCTLLVNNTPQNFEESLKNCKDYLENCSLKHKMLVINSWNEWTEGSYLEPDEEHGYAYLESIKRLFKK